MNKNQPARTQSRLTNLGSQGQALKCQQSVSVCLPLWAVCPPSARRWVCVNIHTHTHACTVIDTYTHSNSYNKTYICRYMYIHICIYIYTHTLHTNIHTYTCIHRLVYTDIIMWRRSAAQIQTITQGSHSLGFRVLDSAT